MGAEVTILKARGDSQEERLCRCGRRASSVLSYAEDLAHQDASPASTPSSPLTNASYWTPPFDQVTTLVPVLKPADIHLPSPDSSEEETIPIPLPLAPIPGCQVGGQHCWTHHKADDASGAGTARLFQSSTGIQGKARTQPYPTGLGSSVWGTGSWCFQAGQHLDAPEHGALSLRVFKDRVSNLPSRADRLVGRPYQVAASSSDEENSSAGSFESTQEVVGPLVKIQEVDPEVGDKDACELLDAMDREVRSCLLQHCKSKRHRQPFAPFPKGWKVDCAHE